MAAEKKSNGGETALAAPPAPPRPAVAMGRRGVVLESMDDLARFARTIHASGLAPKGMQSPEAVAVAIQMGLELGLSPMMALQNIAVINGRPGIFGDAALALVTDSGLLADFAEWYESGGKQVDSLGGKMPDDACAVCFARRVGRDKGLTSRFAVADAKLAKLWGKEGPWSQYPARMLRFRARGFALRDLFPDVLRGFRTAEELQDIPPDRRPAAPGPSQALEAPTDEGDPDTAAEREAVAAEGKE